jgi:hypothetical protein
MENRKIGTPHLLQSDALAMLSIIAVSLRKKGVSLCDSPLEMGGGVCFYFEKLVAETHPCYPRSFAPPLERGFLKPVVQLIA